MRYYIIAGEASGDLHGSHLMNSLRELDPDAEFRFWGGDMMVAAGGTPVQHINKTSFMGFWEVLRNTGHILAMIRHCKKDLAGYMPDALILIDYPGFNLRIARFAHKLGITVFYYISPKVWAWNQSRVKIIKKYVDHMLTIFPFETSFYGNFGYKVDYVGNPLLDAIENRAYKDENAEEFSRRNGLSGRPVISILAGSRLQEIKKCLPVMLSVIPHFSDYQFVIAGAPSVNPDIYLRYTENKVPVLFSQTYPVLQHSVAALVVSGTATLEAALLGVPLVVCYRGSYLSYQIAKRFIRVEYISLVNLIMEKMVVRELIQYEFNTATLRQELNKLLYDENYRKRMLSGMRDLRLRLGEQGASKRAAEKIFGYIRDETNTQQK